MRLRWYLLITCWYALARELEPPHVAPSSVPLYPPKETATSPPLARTALTTPVTVVSALTLRAASPSQAGVQPPESSTRARLKFLSPPALIASVMSCGLLSSGMKKIGLRNEPFGGGGTLPVGDGVGDGEGERDRVGDGDRDCDGVGDSPPVGPFSVTSSAK